MQLYSLIFEVTYIIFYYKGFLLQLLITCLFYDYTFSFECVFMKTIYVQYLSLEKIFHQGKPVLIGFSMFWRSICLATARQQNEMADDSRRRDLCKLFNKFKKEELLRGLIERGILKEDFVDTEGTKKAFINRILRSCFHGEVKTDQVALMDLLCKQGSFMVPSILYR